MEGACCVVACIALSPVILTQNQLSAADLECVGVGDPLYDQGLGSNPAVPEDLSEVLSQQSDDDLQTLRANNRFEVVGISLDRRKTDE